MTCACGSPIDVAPDAAAWAQLLLARAVDERSTAFRRQLSLSEGPVILSGHQAGLWHCGILAKRFAVEAAGRSLGASPAWVIVDHDTNDAGAIRYPVSTDGRTIARTLRIGPDAKPDTPTGARPAGSIPPMPTIAGLEPFVEAGLERLLDALSPDHASLAEQMHAAVESLAQEAGTEDVPSFCSTRIARTDLWAELVDAIARDPAACRASYNRAAEGSGGIVRPLREGELPLWSLGGIDQPRAVVSDSTLGSLSPEALAPRALLLTALLRSSACELFIHGTGGGGNGAVTSASSEAGYDAATDAWLDVWNPIELPTLAPVTVVTATRLLPFSCGGAPSAEDIEKAKWLAQKAKHDPSLVGDTETADKREAILAQSEEAKAKGENPAPIFAELQALLKDYRERHAHRLEELVAEADRIQARAKDAALLADRTWPFALHPRETIFELRSEILETFRIESG